ncbi:pimeloyl-ACP methyl ester carboxylesterase [Streptomyces sp. SAI-208]|nr:pimeloyl-ACP methyl ester carboxylesterase [Streptomyces sp. SAI-090]MDH6549961.1 pimeloyl-ACP methyl ester carboxylesterase [Streptomyces sp. SAI-041]MDH6608595.1 pimeloyl-ACP methyl ester carboxylesterase [Streptomyces sp. SAI-208]MDH6618173.1 pimeloyl-ACP methyl ester carboxylesterase [Streptomyces sp. SAI-135]
MTDRSGGHGYRGRGRDGMRQDANALPVPAARALLPRLSPPDPRAAVVVLHGGRATSERRTRSWQLAALRMDPFVRSVTALLPRQDILVAQVRYRLRGWNGSRADPVRDTRQALDELAELTGPVPTVLLGHSMGGRAALHAAGHPQVRGVVALAPWWPPGEPVDHLAGRHVVALHGDQDRVTSLADTADCVRRARRTATRAGLAVVGAGDHAMLRRHRLWHRTAAGAVAHLLDPEGTPDPLPAGCYRAGDVPVL